MTLLVCRRAMGGEEEGLRNGYGDNVSRWLGIIVKWGRVAELQR